MSGTRVIAIDGAAGSGKSTLARGLGRALALPYINTGLMYRAVAAAALEEGVSPYDAAGLAAIAVDLRYRMTDSDPPELEIEGWPPDRLITLEVERTVSAVARHPEVRAPMRAAQRALGEPGAVMEGRDIASVVFPDAAVKLYLRADPDARAARRAQERTGDDGNVQADLHARDRWDERTNPLVPAEGAQVLDTGRLDVGETLEAALTLVKAQAPALMP